MTKTEWLFDESERAQRLLARLAPGALDPRRVRADSSGLDRLTPADIAAAVGMLRRPGPNGASMPDRFAQALILYKWAGHDDAQTHRALVREIVVAISAWAAAERWRIRKGRLQSLAELAIAEMISPEVCRACNGAGEVWDSSGQQVVCEACAGVGRFPWSMRRRAQVVGMHGESWRVSWDRRYRRVLGLLEEVEGRLQLLNNLKRKYGPSLEDVMRHKDKLSMMVVNLDQKRAELERINGRLKDMEEDIASEATVLSRERKRVAKELEKSVVDEMRLLDMGGTRFEVRFHQQGVGQEDDSGNRMRAIKADGYDKVEFMLSPNVGEELRPLSRIASGGELSRIMLAMKTILARTASVETLIFDEVDSGIGGATAEVVGEKLQSLAAYHQILCITHLPQIASKGPTHFLVKKRVKERRAQTIISELDAEARVNEIARLLGGKVVSPEALAHAKEMMS